MKKQVKLVLLIAITILAVILAVLLWHLFLKPTLSQDQPSALTKTTGTLGTPQKLLDYTVYSPYHSHTQKTLRLFKGDQPKIFAFQLPEMTKTAEYPVAIPRVVEQFYSPKLTKAIFITEDLVTREYEGYLYDFSEQKLRKIKSSFWGADWINETEFIYTVQEEDGYKIKRYNLSSKKQQDVWTDTQLAATQVFYRNGQITASFPGDVHFTLKIIDLSGRELFEYDGLCFGYPRRLNQQLIAFLDEDDLLAIFDQTTRQVTKLGLKVTSTDLAAASSDGTMIVAKGDSQLYQCSLGESPKCQAYPLDKRLKIEQMVGIYNKTVLFIASENYYRHYLYKLDLP
jgi:hypothetical protein